jgi:hypothetical protein
MKGEIAKTSQLTPASGRRTSLAAGVVQPKVGGGAQPFPSPFTVLSELEQFQRTGTSDSSREL